MLARVRKLHDIGFCHRDLKPANMVFGLPQQPNENILFLIDFGLSKKFSDNEGPDEPLPEAKLARNLRLTGTPIYAPINGHLGWGNCYKKDDIESLLYISIHLLKGQLPWQNLRAAHMENYYSIYESKLNISSDELCAGLPK